MNDSPLLQHLRGDHPRKLDDLTEDFARLRRLGCRCEGLPETKAELVTQLDELGREGLVKCGPQGWEPTFQRMPVKVKLAQQELFV